ncbi:MAG: hypothetical protein WAU86_12305 [Oricola sp.]
MATLGAAGVEVAQQVMAETQSAILPLVLYLDTLRWVFIAVALGGIAVTIHARVDDWKRGAAVIAGLLTGIATSPWMRAALRYGAIVLTVLLFLLTLRRSGERAGRLAERLETTEKANDVQRQMLEAAARRPRNLDELVDRLRDGGF